MAFKFKGQYLWSLLLLILGQVTSFSANVLSSFICLSLLLSLSNLTVAIHFHHLRLNRVNVCPDEDVVGGWKLWYSVPGKGLTISHFCILSKSNHIFILKFLLSLRHHQHQPPHTPSSISTMDQPASHRNPVASLLTLGSWDLNQTMKNHLLNSFRFQYYGPTGEWSKSSPREYLNLLLLLVVWVVELPERGFICYWGYAKRCFCRSVWTDKANDRIMATFESSPAAAAAWCVNMWVALNGRGSVLTTTTILNEEWLVKGEFSGL